MLLEFVMNLAIKIAVWILPAWLREEYTIEYSGDAYDAITKKASTRDCLELAYRMILSSLRIRFYYIGKPRREVIKPPETFISKDGKKS